MKPVNFHSAARRHFQDAELLWANTREANAGHLYGFVAECGIKALLVSSGLQVDASGDILKRDPFRLHADKLSGQINQVHNFLQGRTSVKYLAQVPDIGHFSDWSTDHRYYDESALPPSTAKWRSAAQQVMSMLDQAKIDGVIL
ncbi:MAG: hypothetical protein HY267_00135 [Deltaproteobacteria bacterium]|nr:hypothetical protein [Deltaproteobacteria bacterium]